MTETNENIAKSANYSEIAVVSDYTNCCSIKMFDIRLKRVDFCNYKGSEDLVFACEYKEKIVSILQN